MATLQRPAESPSVLAKDEAIVIFIDDSETEIVPESDPRDTSAHSMVQEPTRADAAASASTIEGITRDTVGGELNFINSAGSDEFTLYDVAQAVRESSPFEPLKNRPMCLGN